MSLAFLVLVDDHTYVAAILEVAEQDLVGQRFLDVLLDHARHRPRTHQLIVAIGDQPAARFVREFDRNVAVAEQLGLKFQHEFLDHLGDHILAKDAQR